MSFFTEFSVPAKRRGDDVEEEDDSDFDVSVDGSIRSAASKRPRLTADEASEHGDGDNGGVDVELEVDHDNDDPLEGIRPPNIGDEEDLESQAGDLLPDSFRRSPRGPPRGPPTLPIANGAPRKHQPGSIVRVKLTDFVTYTAAEFQPGPNLNMIIGPNGTGKSTLVCAICLGLGWSTSHLGRAKDLGEFVKHGARKGEIEIELAADARRHRTNPVITTRITKEGNKSEYLIDGKKANRKGVQDLARSFSIQVDNLCQFLPQDRVVEFAALSPVDLLTHTQRAAAPDYMSEWHDELKELRKNKKTQQVEQQNVIETLKGMETRQRLQEADVTRLRERAGLKDRITAFEKLRPFPKYTEASARYTDAKARRKEAEKELRLLQRRVEPNLRAANEKKEYLARVNKVAEHRRNLVGRSEKMVDETMKEMRKADEEIEGCNQEIEAESTSVKSTKQSIPKLNQDIAKIRRAMETPPEEIDLAAVNAQIREKARLGRDVEQKVQEIKDRAESLNVQISQRERVIEDKTREREGLKSQAGQQVSKLKQNSKDAATAWDWIQKNKNAFQGTVYGPPIVECTLKDVKHAAAVESMIPDGDKLSFTVTTQADHKTLLDKVSALRLHDINIRMSLHPLSAYQPPMSTERLREFGMEGWLIDLIDGPEAVIAMLCDNRNVHQIAYSTRDISNANYEALGSSSISAWVTSTRSYQSTRRREYGEGAVSTRTQALKQPRFFTNAPVDRQLEQAIERTILETKDEVNELHQNKAELSAESKDLSEQKKQLDKEKKEIDDYKRQKQGVLSQFNGLGVKLDGLETRLTSANEAIAGYRDRVRVINDKTAEISIKKGQLALNYAKSVDALRGLRIQAIEAEIMQIEAKSDLTQLEAQHADEVRQLNERKAEVEELAREQAILLEAGKRLQDECRNIGRDFTEVEGEVYNLIMGVGHDENGEEIEKHHERWSTDQLETEVQSLQARLEMTHGGGGQNTIQEFERRAGDIEVKKSKLADLEAVLGDVEEKIREIRDQWEPELDQLVGKISEAFKENFEQINCVGEVAVHKDEEFEQWAIQIRVKFRETEQLSVLDSHRQSGGERAVSTIFYLMALQSLARAPFRVVDEINQGMDPRNERLVHSRMVDIACASGDDGRPGSQYFLITPKLLSGLRYHPDMKVHCIASGEHMPADHRELDFGTLAEKALALRAVRAVG